MNTFGHVFRVTTFGESHGEAIGALVDGCPAGLSLQLKDFSVDLARRRTAQSSITSSRKEGDRLEILSGVFEGRTLGTPICLLVKNIDSKPEHYDRLKNTYRPSHADFTYDKKFGFRDYRGGGRASARETLARVLAGVIAKKLLRQLLGLEILAYVKQVGHVTTDIDPLKVRFSDVESNAVRCPDQKVAKKMIDLIKSVQKKGDTVGGVVECFVRNVPAGLGDPIFDKLKATLARAMMSIPATMGFEMGSGFSCLPMRGSEHNDAFFVKTLQGKKIVLTKTNHSGGIQGGISNGMPILFRTVFKPVSTLFQEQQTVTKDMKPHQLTMLGRHDPCVVPRAVVIVEAMAAITLIDHVLRQRAVKLEGA